MNYYERHLGDYARDAGHLSMLEHGAYSLLLDRYYTTEQGIPQDQVHRICRARTNDERRAVDVVLAEFFVLKDGLWINGRAEREILKMQTKVKAARENGKRGGRPKQTEQKPNGLSVGSDLETQDKAHQPPDTRHQEEAHASSARGRVGKALKAGGMDLGMVNLSDPRLTALLDQGATPDEFEGIAKEAVAGHKGFAWVLTVLQSRRAEAAAITLAPKAEDLTPWHETRSGIEAKGASLGLGKWDEEAFAQGRGEQWPAYRNKVFKAAGHNPMERVA